MDLSSNNIFNFIKEHRIEEVEFRYKFPVSDIIRFLEINKQTFAPKCSIERTTNIIYLDPSKRREDFIVTKDYDTENISYSTKHREISIKLTNSTTLNVSNEKSSSGARKPSGNPLVRIKNRLTIPHEDGRFDVTQVAQIEKASAANIQVINSRKKDLFVTMDGYKGEDLYDAFINNMYNPVISSVELEYEFKKVTSPDQLTIEYSNRLLGEEYAASVAKTNILMSIARDIGARQGREISLKTILTNATCLTPAIYNRIFPPLDYYITPKADGFVGIVAINKDGKSYIIYSDQIIEVDYTADKYTLLVGEVVGKTFYCFEILIHDGTLMVQRSFSERLDSFMKYLSEPIKFGEFTVVAKDHILITDDLQRSFKSVTELPITYEIDGYVLVSPNNTYAETKYYKIKPSNTIDFLAVECPLSLKKEEMYKKPEGTTGETYLLFCSINEYELERIMIQQLKGYQTLFPQRFNGMMPIQFAPTDNPLAYIWHSTNAETKILKEAQKKGRLIVELDYDIKQNKWKLIRIREDRINEPNYFGNHFLKVAEPSWFAIKHPLKIEDLSKPLSNYFGTGKGDIYKAPTGFNSYTKSKLLTKATSLVTSKTVIDLAAGKGQDLARYYDSEYSKGIFCDIDAIALSELIARRADITKDKTRKNKMQVFTVHRDLTLPADDTAEIFKPFIKDNNVGLIVCNFAIHYLITDIDKLNNFIRLIRSISNRGTIFYFTTMSGRAVTELLGSGNEWKAHEKGLLKYHIVKKYHGNQLMDMGQTIQTKMPFSDELYTENLVNIDLVNQLFVKYGFNLIASESFRTFFNPMKRDNPRVFNLLTEDDKKYVGLYHYSMFEC